MEVVCKAFEKAFRQSAAGIVVLMLAAAAAGCSSQDKMYSLDEYNDNFDKSAEKKD
ncbi:MAG: hypothetical protein HUJ54_09555 [Erysipelotrichaceae bacterium]|nr:hypothetical protein [Erysipelotrichaceae bacterium]